MTPPPGPFQFGPFELDPANFRLRRSGRLLRLERIPLELLIFLVERRGRLVSREEIAEKIWGKDVFVDIDNAVNTAIRKIRRALGDAPEHPRYVETVPSKGYRFLGSATKEAAVESAKSEGGQRAIAAPRTMVAVLPLENLDTVPGCEFFTEGMTEELITQLGRGRPQLGVIARTSVMKYKQAQRSVRRVSKDLGVEYLVEGSVRSDAARVRIHVRLIQASDQTQLWAGIYEGGLENRVNLQAQLAREIAAEVSQQLRAENAISVDRAAEVVKPAAYEAYLKGRFFWNKRTEEDVERSLRCFSGALELDPGFARAYAGLADAYIFLANLGFRRSDEMYPRAEAAALKALSLDATLAEPHASLADVRKGYNWDWEEAEIEYRRALELNPSYAVAHHWYAEYLSKRGRHDAAIAEIQRARELDPLSVPITAFVGYLYYRARRYEQAEREIRCAIELDPHLPLPHWFLGQVFEQRPDLGLATQEHYLAVQLSRGSPVYVAALGHAHARAGNLAQARTALDQLEALSRERYVSAVDFATVHAGLKNRDAAFEWLEKAYQERAMRIQELPEPRFDGLRSDPRFRDLLRRIGLAVALRNEG